MEFRRVLFRSADRLMKVRLLGCATSSGVPRVGNDWGVWDPLNPRNRRTRASIMVEADGYRILVDTGPVLREQLLAADIGRRDAVIDRKSTRMKSSHQCAPRMPNSP